jgi:general secretion pathway protein F
MSAFEYRALNASGATEKGVLTADTAKAVRGLLRERGLTPLAVDEVREAKAGESWRERLNQPLRTPGLSAQSISVLTRQFATLVRAGLPLDETLSSLAEQSESREARRLLSAVRAKVMEGSALAAALANFPRSFDALYCASVDAGERSGQLSTVLERLADFTEQRANYRSQFTAGLVYPVLLLGVAFCVVTGLLAFVVPQVADVFDSLHAQLPWLTRALIAVSHGVNHYGWLLAMAFVGFIALTIWALRQPTVRGRLDRWLLRVPGIGKLIASIEASRFARTLAIAHAASVPVLPAIKIGQAVVSNVAMNDSLTRVHAAVREGESLSYALKNTGLFPPLLARLIGSGEKSGQLGTMLEHAAELQERQVQTRLNTALSLLQPATILLMGIVVLLIVLAILLPIFELNQLIK